VFAYSRVLRMDESRLAQQYLAAKTNLSIMGGTQRPAYRSGDGRVVNFETSAIVPWDQECAA